MEVSYGIARIIYKNQSRMEGFYDVESMDVDINTGQIVIRGSVLQVEKVRRSIEDISNWFVEAIDIHAQSVNFLETLRDEYARKNMENVFDVYVFMENAPSATLLIFGSESNVDRASEYVRECIQRDRIVPLPWIPQGSLRLWVDREDTENVSIRDGVAVVVPLTAEYGIEHRDDNLAYVEKVLLKYGITFDIFNIKQRVTGVAKPMKDNPVGLLTVAGRVVPKEYRRFIVVDPSTELDRSAFQKYIFRTLLLSTEEAVQVGNTFVLNGRRILQDLPEYLYGVGLDALPMLLTDMGYTVGKVYPSEVSQTPNLDAYRACRYKSIVREGARYFRILDGASENNERERLIDVEFLEEVHVLTKEEIPPVREGATPYSYLKFYHDYLTAMKGSQGIQGSRDVDFGAMKLISIGKNKNVGMLKIGVVSEADTKRVQNKATLYANLCKNIVDVSELVYDVKVEDGSVVVRCTIGKVAEESTGALRTIHAPYLPYYTVRNKMYVRDITEKEVGEFGEVISQLKRDHPATVTSTQYPTHIGMYITRIGDIVFYYSKHTDNVELYDVASRDTLSDLPAPLSEDLSEDDLDMMLVLFKDKNANVLRVVSEGERFYQNPRSITDLTVIPRPKRSRDLLTPNASALKNLLKLEPIIDDYDLTERSVQVQY